MTPETPDVGDVDGALGAFQHAPAHLYALEGRELRIVSANATARARLGGGEDFVGRPVADVFGGVTGQQWIQRLVAVYETGEPFSARQWRLKVASSSGPRDVYVDVDARPWRHPEGSVRGVLVQAVDVTDRALARQRLESATPSLVGRLPAARGMIATLQDALLPRELPVVPHLDVAATYLLAADDSDAGGDWFDAVVRPGGEVALAVGDVVGHGVGASAAMGQLSAILHARLLSRAPLSEVLADLDYFASRQGESRAATACVLQVHPDSGDFVYCTADHPPPLLVSATGEAAYLEGSGGRPLATGATYATCTGRLAPGELVVLYSDGIIERPGRTPAQSSVEFAQIVGEAVRGSAGPDSAARRLAERVSSQALALSVRATGHRDDITLLVAQSTAAPLPLAIRVAPHLDSIPLARRRLAEWLRSVGARPVDDLALQHAVGELVSNSVQHAYGDHAEAGAWLTVDASLASTGEVVVKVADGGRWREPRPSTDRGRGLAMAAGMADDLQIHHDRQGTRAIVRYRLARPANLITAELASGPHLPSEPSVEMEVLTEQGRVVLTGALDQVGTSMLAPRLARITQQGLLSTVVDLAGVTQLGSQAVRMLLDLRGIDTSADRVRLYAPAGSVAQHVLDVVGLPHLTDLPEPD